MQKSEQRMKAICNYIEKYQFEYHCTPSMDPIADAVGTIKINVSKYLGKMEHLGMMHRDKRSIIIHSRFKLRPKLNHAPII